MLGVLNIFSLTLSLFLSSSRQWVSWVSPLSFQFERSKLRYVLTSSQASKLYIYIHIRDPGFHWTGEVLWAVAEIRRFGHWRNSWFFFLLQKLQMHYYASILLGRVGINIRSQNKVKKGLNSCEGHFKLFPIICQLVFQTSIHKQPKQYMQYNKIVCFRKSTFQKEIKGIPSRTPWVCILQIQKQV